MENETQTKSLTEIQPESNTETQTTQCLNCGTEFEGKFCPECGQSAETGRFTFKFIWENLIAAILGRDGGIWFTLKNLFSRPGAMIVDILNGKRRKYLSPFPTLFLALTLYVLVFTATGSKSVNISDMQEDWDVELNVKVGENTMELSDNNTATAQMMQKASQLVVKGYKFYLNHYALCYMLTLPLFIIAARRCYGKENRKRYYWAEYIVAVVYAMVMLVLYRCLINLIYPISPDFYEKMAIFEPVAIIIALTACIRKMMGFGMVKTIWRSTLTTALYYLMVGIIAFVVIVAISSFFVFRYLR